MPRFSGWLVLKRPVTAAASNAAGMVAQELPFGREVERTLKLKGSCTRPTVFDHPYLASKSLSCAVHRLRHEKSQFLRHRISPKQAILLETSHP